MEFSFSPFLNRESESAALLAVLLISNVIPHQQKTKTLNHASGPTFLVSLPIFPHLLIRCLLVN